jgi:hypothetical protein
MNYLVLTPDGVGSTYLQRALTVYLNSSGMDYYNTHELLNGLKLTDDNILYKKMAGYSQSIEEIVELIRKNEGLIISRLAQYHVEDRLAGKWATPKGVMEVAPNPEISERNKREDYSIFYDTCRNSYDKLIYCTRDPFEYALSWCIRSITRKLNVYSIKERIDTHNKDSSYDIDLEFFLYKLDQYKRYIYWVKDNFKNAVEIKYDDVHQDIDTVLSNISGEDYKVSDTWDISLQDYSTMLYKVSNVYNKNVHYSDNLVEYQSLLVSQKKLFRGMAIKMTTLRDKSKSVSNFMSSLETYNKWAKSSNEYPELSEEQILDKIEREEQIYL